MFSKWYWIWKYLFEQIRVKGEKGDVLIALSGSGNSKNILNALKIANKLGIKTHSILGFDGGHAKKFQKFYSFFSKWHASFWRSSIDSRSCLYDILRRRK